VALRSDIKQGGVVSMSEERSVVQEEGTGPVSRNCDGEQTATALPPWEVENVAGSLSETVMSLPDPKSFAEAEPPTWATPQQLAAAYALSLGLNNAEAAQLAGVSRTTLWRWMTHDVRGAEYKAFIRRLTFLTGLARRSVRLALAKKMALHLYQKEMTEGQRRHTSLDWFRHVAELSGEREPVPLPLGVQLAQQVIFGSRINVEALRSLAAGSENNAEAEEERPSKHGEQQGGD
jgi:hypothetical protein